MRSNDQHLTIAGEAMRPAAELGIGGKGEQPLGVLGKLWLDSGLNGASAGPSNSECIYSNYIQDHNMNGVR